MARVDRDGSSRRRWIGVLAAVVGGLAAPAAAEAGYQFDRAWGSQGSAEGEFGTTIDIAVDPDDDSIFVTDDFRQRIQKFEPDGDFVSAWGWGVDTGASAYEICTLDCQAGTAGTGNGQFSAPQGVATDASGNVYVVEAVNNRIQKFDSSGNFLTKWGGAGAAEGQFNSPHGVAIDDAGNVYVVDTFNQRVQVFEPDGDFVRMWGWGVDNGAAALQVCTSGCQAGTSGSGQGQLSFPESATISPAGDRVYVTDASNHRIVVFSPAGAFVTAFGANGTGAGQFNLNIGIEIVDGSNLLVVDANQRIQKFTAAGDFLGTFGWGVSDGSPAFQVCTANCQAGLVGSGNGQFNSALGLDVDSAGYVYVADRSNARVQRFAAIAPATTIDSAPPPTTADDTPTFTFRSSLPDSTFMCRVDTDPFAACDGANQTVGGETTGGFTSAAITDGSHSFEVRALDQVAIPDETPAEADFVVDTQAPSVSDLDVEVNKRRATVTFAVADPPPGTPLEAECRLDAQPFEPCASGKRFRRLSDGRHKVRVRASDEAGNQSAVAAKRFQVR